MECQTITGQAKRRGFNLIEAAIVLGVVGVVIGAIWGAASAVSENLKINETHRGIIKMYQEGCAIPNLSYLPTGDQTLLFREMKIAPEHWRRDNIGRILDPWGNVSLPYLLGDGIFGISLREIPQGRCQKIVSAISSAFKNTGRTQLDRIWFLDGGLLTGPWPAATFVQECHEGINTEVYFFFHVCSRN